MTKEKDIVTDILERVEAAVRDFCANDLGFEQQLADAIARQIRAQDQPVRRYWARSEAYVPARSPEKSEAQRKALEEARRTGRVRESAERNGVSRATLYRKLKGMD